MLHSVLVDPRDPSHLYLGLSGGGVFESTDGGGDWAPLNQGVAADFFPDPNPEFGHDPHTVRLHPQMPDRLYQQNHCGIYRLDRPEDRWTRIGDNMPREIGDIGFPIELHPRDPDTAWVFPMDGTDVWPRTSVDGRPAAYITRDAGASWTAQTTGLPDRAWYTVKRQAMTTDAEDPVGRVLRDHLAARCGRAATRASRGAASPGTCRRSTPSRSDDRMKVRIPTPLRAYTNQQKVVEGEGATVSEVLDDLDRRFPGIRFRMVDEQNRLRQHMNVWIGQDPVTDLAAPVTAADEITIMQALSGG